jgi:hypothetical protein
MKISNTILIILIILISFCCKKHDRNTNKPFYFIGNDTIFNFYSSKKVVCITKQGMECILGSLHSEDSTIKVEVVYGMPINVSFALPFAKTKGRLMLDNKQICDYVYVGNTMFVEFPKRKNSGSKMLLIANNIIEQDSTAIFELIKTINW